MISDPLFAELRRRHPDVDLLLLPPAPVVESSTGPAGVPVPIERARATVVAVRALAQQLAPGSEVVERWAPLGAERYRFESHLRRPGTPEDLESIGDALLIREYDARPFTDRIGLLAQGEERGEHLLVEATLGSGVIRVALLAEAATLDPDDLLLLRREVLR